MLRSVRKVIGFVMIGLGLAGLLLPLAPGIPLLVAGVTLIGADHPLVRPLIARVMRHRRRQATSSEKRGLKRHLRTKLRMRLQEKFGF